MYIYIHIFTHIHIYICVCVCIDMHIYTYLHVHHESFSSLQSMKKSSSICTERKHHEKRKARKR